MRRIDLWVGVPICFLLTLVYRLQRLLGFADPRLDEGPKNVLFIQLAEMGTMVVAYPALRKMRESYPDANLYFLSFSEIRGSVELIDVIDPEKIWTIDGGSPLTLLRDTVGFLWRARRHRIDTVLNLETFVRFSSILSFLCGARKRAGYHRFSQEGIYTGDFLTHKVLYNAGIHAAHAFLDLVHALRAPIEEIPINKRARAEDDLSIPRREPDPAAIERLWRMLRERSSAIGEASKLVVLSPNNSERFPMRKLPLEDYGELTRKLLADPDLFVVVTGVPREKPDAEAICAHVGSDRVIDLTGATTFLELFDLFEMAHVLVTNDSGPAHFACMTDVHIVVFFGPELPARYRPLSDRCDIVYQNLDCSPCSSPYNQRRTPCNNNLCLQNIDLDALAGLIRSRVDEEEQRRSRPA
jgi:ADP-heptose:LPS heptosyltransferase